MSKVDDKVDGTVDGKVVKKAPNVYKVDNMTIMECSRFQSADTQSNAEWTTTLSKNVILSPGDKLSVKKVFVNSNLSDLDNIEISNDTWISMAYGYYDVNYTNQNKSNANTDIDYDYYIAYSDEIGGAATLSSVSVRGVYDPFQKNPMALILDFWATENGKGVHYTMIWGYENKNMPDVFFPKPEEGEHSNVTVTPNIANVTVNTLKYTVDVDAGETWGGANWLNPGPGGLLMVQGSSQVLIPRGEYTRTGISKLITDSIQLAQPLYNSPNPSTGNDFMRRTDDNTVHYPCNNMIVANRFIVFLSGTFADVQAVNNIGLTIGSNLSVTYMSRQPDGSRISKSVDAVIFNIAVNQGTATITFTGPVFDANEDVYDVRIVKVIANQDISFRQCGNDPATAKTYHYETPTFYGSSQNVLLYDDDRGVFSWSYYHMPYFAGNPATESIIQVKDQNGGDVDGQYFTITQSSGIFFTDLQPRNFWIDTLGFNIDQDLLCPIQVINTRPTVARADIDSKITKGFSGLSSLIPLGNRNIDINQAVATTDTIQIFGQSLDNLDAGGGGYYLVTLSCMADNDYVHNTGRMNVGAVVGKYNQIKDYVEGYSDVSVDYINNKDTEQSIKNVQIRILDPHTRTPVTDLGPDSTIFLQIDHVPKAV